MNSVATLSGKVYGLLTRLYPAEFRSRWEAELADTFAQEVADAGRRDGWRGVVAAWFWALAEVPGIVLTPRIAGGAVVVPVTATFGAGAVFYGMMWALGNSQALRALYHRMF